MVADYSSDHFAQWVRERWPKLALEAVKRSDKPSGFVVLLSGNVRFYARPARHAERHRSCGWPCH